MYKRAATRVKIVREDGTEIYLKAVLILHNSWLEVKGWFVERDYKPASGPWDPASRGSVRKKPMNRIYPEGTIKYIEINDEKVDMRKFKKVN